MRLMVASSHLCVDKLLDAVFRLTKFCFEIDAYSEDCACESEALRHVPEDTIGDVAFREERDKGEYYTGHYHKCCGHVLDPFFAVCCHVI